MTRLRGFLFLSLLHSTSQTALFPIFPAVIRWLGNLTMEEHIQVEGKIVSVLAGTMFRVELSNGHQVLAHISGKMRKRFIRLTVGDRVKLEISQYDLNKARIVYRLR